MTDRMLQQGASLKQLYDYVRNLEAEIKSLRVVGDNKTIAVTRDFAGQHVRALQQRGGGGVFGNGLKYDGPFAVGYEFNTQTRMMKIHVNFTYANVYATGTSGLPHYSQKDKLEFNLDSVLSTWMATGIFVYVCVANIDSSGNIDSAAFPAVSSRTAWWIDVIGNANARTTSIFAKDIAFIKMRNGNPVVPGTLSQWWMGGNIHVEGRIV